MASVATASSAKVRAEEHGGFSFGLVTWNLQGRAGLDVGAVAQRVTHFDADVVAFQEVQAGQARALAERLGMQVWWSFKHWPMVALPEGLAVLARTSFVEVRRLRLPPAAPPFSWRRRIAQLARLTFRGHEVMVGNVHLTPHDSELRLREARALLSGLEGKGGLAKVPVVVAGDFNDGSQSSAIQELVRRGLSDSWELPAPGARAGDGATHWLPGSRDAPPLCRLDYVLIGGNIRVLAAEVPAPSSPDFDVYRRLSDHLPLSVRLSVAPAVSARPQPDLRG